MSVVADIAVPVAVRKTFHYRIPEELSGRLAAGSRVVVPFGSRRLTGTIVGFAERGDPAGLKSVIAAAGDDVPLPLLDLARWMSDYYFHPLGLTIETMVPKALSNARPKIVKFIRLTETGQGQPRGRKQRELLRLLEERGEAALAGLAGFGSATIAGLRNAGFVEIIERCAPEAPADASFSADAPPQLMQEQAAAVSQICTAVAAGSFETFLLHGVTGSGKTEVYLHAISGLAGADRGAIVLVPEIALTPQLLGRFRRRFGDRVAVLHSGLTDRERADEYRRISSHEVDVAIGARSAVFAPFARLGLVIVDEEHENSYKQDDGLRYHGRDVAVMRAKLQHAVCVLGSATPSLESFHNAQAGKYRYLTIASRVDHRPMPAVEIIDAKTLPKACGYAPALIEAVQRRLARREQVLLLLNRRGFSSVLICEDCGTVIKCPSCSVSLAFHKSERKLKCHYCDHHAPPPDDCGACGGASMKPLGTGTQKVEEEIAALFPQARLGRMDSDSVRGKKAYETLLAQVDRGEIDILLGTQMIAKGHDFPAVTLVGVVDADVGLNLPDFRAAEKTFQLITQAAGRAGRGASPGEVIIQTLNPEHYSLRHSILHDYAAFYAEEIRYRMDLGYPPVRRIVKVELKSASESAAAAAAAVVRDRVRSLLRGKDVALLGPAPSPISKLRGKHRFQLLLLSARRDLLRQLAVEAQKVVEEEFGRKVQVIVDVDPVNLM